MDTNQELTEQQKAQRIYHLIGERGFYVNTNFDIFTHETEDITLASGTGFSVELTSEGSQVYTSPLLFATLTSLMNHGTMLITGAPGIGKTTSAEYAGHFFTGTPLDEILAAEIHGHPQQKEENMTGSYDLAKLMSGIREVFPTRFLECPVKIMDEVNRNPPDLLSILMQVVDVGKAIYGGQLLIAKKGPLFATANYSDEGNFALTAPFLDRFDVAVMVTSPPAYDLDAIRLRGDEKLNGNGMEEKLKVPSELKLDFNKIRTEINHIPERVTGATELSEASVFADFLYASLRFSECASNSLTRATKGNAWQVNQEQAPVGHFNDSSGLYTINELTVRSVKAMMRYAKAYSWFVGKDEVGLDDLKTVLPYLLWHKVVPSGKALAENQVWANDRIGLVTSLVEKVQTEYSDIMRLDAMKTYQVALGMLHKPNLSFDKIKTVIINAIKKIGNVDKPYALVMAQHLASLYNSYVSNIQK